MLKDDYNIDIIGKQFYGDDNDEVALHTTGSYTQRNGISFIAYKEYDNEDPHVSHTCVLKVEPGKVTMMRAGSSTHLILEEGRRHLCLYDTGFGSLTVGVYTSELKASLEDRHASLEIKYTLDIDSNLSSSNELKVEARLCSMSTNAECSTSADADTHCSPEAVRDTAGS